MRIWSERYGRQNDNKQINQGMTRNSWWYPPPMIPSSIARERPCKCMRTKPARINRFSQMVRAWRISYLLLNTIWIIYRERQRVVKARERGNYDVHPNVEVLVRVLVNFRRTALQLGVLMIKLGQFLSSRADLLPEQALEVLSSLQDEVPPAPFEHVVYVIESELGKPVDKLF